MIRRLLREEEGTTAAEYGFFAVLIALGCIAILLLLGEKVRNWYVHMTGRVDNSG